MKTKKLLYAGYYIPVVFWGTTIISGLILGDYNHLTRLVSELGAIGTASQYLFSTGLIICGILSALFAKALYKECKDSGRSVIPVLIILFYSVSITGAAVFPLPLRLHLYMGMPSILLVLSPLLSFFLWKDKAGLPGLKQLSIFCLFIMLLGFLVYFPNILSNYFGLKQRFFHLGWSVWFAYLSYGFLKTAENKYNSDFVLK